MNNALLGKWDQMLLLYLDRLCDLAAIRNKATQSKHGFINHKKNPLLEMHFASYFTNL